MRERPNRGLSVVNSQSVSALQSVHQSGSVMVLPSGLLGAPEVVAVSADKLAHVPVALVDVRRRAARANELRLVLEDLDGDQLLRNPYPQ